MAAVEVAFLSANVRREVIDTVCNVIRFNVPSTETPGFEILRGSG
jgi:hypothetical protein